LIMLPPPTSNSSGALPCTRSGTAEDEAQSE
jgi:hypothetical protein